MLKSINKYIKNDEFSINILENNILSNAKLPYSVQSILSNPRLGGIHGTISSLTTAAIIVLPSSECIL